MKTNMIFSVSFAALAATALSAVPSIDASSITISKDAATGLVTVDYKLVDAPGVVTVAFETNVAADASGAWAPVDDRAASFVSGDVNRFLTNGDDVKRIYWQPGQGLPQVDIPANCLRAKVTAWAPDDPPDYAVIDLICTNDYRYYASAEAIPFTVGHRMYKTDKIVLRRIPAKEVTWRMGSHKDEAYRERGGAYPGSEEPRYVTLSEDYYMGIYEVTKEQYRHLMGIAPGTWGGEYGGAKIAPVLPVEYISYYALRGDDTDSFKGWPDAEHDVVPNSVLGKIRAYTGIEFDLPTEAQWEYACRAGTGEALYTGRHLTSNSGYCANLAEIAWYASHKPTTETLPDGSKVEIFEVGLLPPNNWGLYDMLGNVSEHCLDRTDLEKNPGTLDMSARDPKGLKPSDSITLCVIRGGSTVAGASITTSAARDDRPYNRGIKYTGFRLCAPAMAMR